MSTKPTKCQISGATYPISFTSTATIIALCDVPKSGSVGVIYSHKCVTLDVIDVIIDYVMPEWCLQHTDSMFDIRCPILQSDTSAPILPTHFKHFCQTNTSDISDTSERMISFGQALSISAECQIPQLEHFRQIGKNC